jgi:hypothetical protein
MITKEIAMHSFICSQKMKWKEQITLVNKDLENLQYKFNDLGKAWTGYECQNYSIISERDKISNSIEYLQLNKVK